MSLVPVVASADALPDAIKYAEQHPSARWYVAKRAGVFGSPEIVPDSWGVAVGDAVSAVVASSAATDDDTAVAARWYAAEQAGTLAASTATEDLDTAARKRLAKKGQAMKDGSYPIPNRTFLAKAIKAFGRAKNKAATKRHIIKRARGLRSTDLIPDSWKPLTSAATVTADEVGLWVAQVRDLLTQAGHDPDDFEAGSPFEDDYAEYKDQPQMYVDELIAAFADDDEADDEAETPDEPETETPGDGGEQTPSPVPGQSQVPSLSPANTAFAPVVPVAAGASYATSANPPPGLVQVFTAPQQPATAADRDALLAAVRQVLREERDQTTLAAAVKDPDKDGDDDTPVTLPDGTTMPGPGDTDQDMGAGPDAVAPDAAPVPDLEAAKAALRDKHGSKGKRKPPPAKAAAPMAASAMRDRIAAKAGEAADPKGDAPDGAITAGNRYRHGWIPIDGAPIMPGRKDKAPSGNPDKGLEAMTDSELQQLADKHPGDRHAIGTRAADVLAKRKLRAKHGKAKV